MFNRKIEDSLLRSSLLVDKYIYLFFLIFFLIQLLDGWLIYNKTHIAKL